MCGKFELLSTWKGDSYKCGTTHIFPVLCIIFSCFHTIGFEAYYFTTYEYGIFNVCTNAGACRTHEGVVLRWWWWCQAQQACTRVNSEGQNNNCLSPCPASGSNPGSSDWNNSNVLTTQLRSAQRS